MGILQVGSISLPHRDRVAKDPYDALGPHAVCLHMIAAIELVVAWGLIARRDVKDRIAACRDLVHRFSPVNLHVPRAFAVHVRVVQRGTCPQPRRGGPTAGSSDRAVLPRREDSHETAARSTGTGVAMALPYANSATAIMPVTQPAPPRTGSRSR